MSDKVNAMIDRLERAAMAYERLGKIKKDDEKSRSIRKDAISELSYARVEIVKLIEGNK